MAATGAGPPARWFAALRDALDRPLTAYYLLLGASALLLTIGLIMVLSASSVYSYQVNDGDSYAVVRRQLVWVLIGLPLRAGSPAGCRMRLDPPARLPGFSSRSCCCCSPRSSVSTVNGNQNWLALGPVQIQPSEIAKLALVVWAAHVYANKERRLDSTHEIMVPVVPGHAPGDRPGRRRQRPRHRAGAGRDPARDALGGRRPAPVLHVCSRSRSASSRSVLVATNAERLARITNFIDPFKDYHGAGWQPAHGLYALSTGGLFGEGIGASQQKWGDLPEAHTDFIFAVLGEELGLAGTLLVVGLFLTIAFAALRVARHTADPFVRYATFGIVVWLLGQMIINVGMVLALLPVIGIPLPLVSYGGSACSRPWSRSACWSGSRAASRRPPAHWPSARKLRVGRAVGRGSTRPVTPETPTLADTMRVLLAGGGTAGHTSPLLATADALRRLEPDGRDHLPGHTPWSGEPGGPRGRLPARADPAGAAARASRRPDLFRVPAGCAARSRRPARSSTGCVPTSWSATAATSPCRPTSPRAAARCPGRPRAERAARAGQQGRRPVRAPGRGELPGHAAAAGRVRRPADPHR